MTKLRTTIAVLVAGMLGAILYQYHLLTVLREENRALQMHVAQADELRTRTEEDSRSKDHASSQTLEREIRNSISTIVVRERTPWTTPGGQLARIYAFADGHSEVHTEPNGEALEEWEAKHQTAQAAR